MIIMLYMTYMCYDNYAIYDISAYMIILYWPDLRILLSEMDFSPQSG